MTSEGGPDAAIAALVDRGATLAVAESLTGGLVTARLVDVPGASAVIVGGVVAYDTAIKRSVLGVPAQLLETHGPVYPDVAIAMARGVRERLAVDGRAADFGLATTGVAGPDPQGAAPVGLVYIAIADARGEQVRELRLSGSRAAIRRAATDAAIALIVERLRTRE